MTTARRRAPSRITWRRVTRASCSAPRSSTTASNLTQDEVGKRLGISRFKVGRLLDRALREDAVRIEIVHPAARLVDLEDALVQRFGLQRRPRRGRAGYGLARG